MKALRAIVQQTTFTRIIWHVETTIALKETHQAGDLDRSYKPSTAEVRDGEIQPC